MRPHGRLVLALGLAALLVAALFTSLPGLSRTSPTVRAAPDSPRHVVLQLKWWHQFQFAGYYAARLQGFYEHEGLAVELREGSPAVAVQSEVLAGRAQFGVSDAAVLAGRLRGEPLVALAAIFQHSPYVLLTLRERGILRPSDLVRRRVMLSGSEAEVQLKALLTKEGVSVSAVDVLPHSMTLEALIAGEVDAVSAYSTVEPAVLRAQGIEPHVIRASDYGIDFYDDILFTSSTLAERDPEMVDAFRRASLRGWEYAMAHRDELVDHILALPGSSQRGLNRDRLLAEAREMAALMVSDVVPIGHINPGRFERMAQIYAEAAGLPRPSLDGFVFQLPPPWIERWRTPLAIGASLSVGLTLVALMWVGQLRGAVASRTMALEREVEQRRATEAQLRISEERQRVVLEEMPVLLAAFDENGTPLAWNRECERVTGYSRCEIVGNPGAVELVLTDPQQRERFKAFARGERVGVPFEWELTARDGTRRVLRAVLSHDRVAIPGWHVWGISLDVTAEREADGVRMALEERLRQARHFESLGMLAGGIAHDFNNLLTSILGNADLALTDLPAGARAAESVKLIEQGARRATELTRQLLAYSGKERIDIQPVDVTPLVADIVTLLDVSVTNQCAITLDVPEGLPAVEADPTRLRQVVMNLVLNSAEAVGGNGGAVAVRTALVHADRALLSRAYVDDQLPEGPYVLIEVRDTGRGMSDDVRQRIFEPFFSTKFQGRGLGLAAALGTVRSHRGTMIVESSPGLGTTFSVLLPASSRVVVAAPPPPVLSDWQGSGLVLVVDDEESVRNVAVRMLGRMGLTTATASDGMVALEVFRPRPHEFAAVLLDLTMPRMGGEETLAALREIRPDLPVVLSSGYHEPEAVINMERAHAVGFIQKPYRFDELRHRMRRALTPSDADVLA